MDTTDTWKIENNICRCCHAEGYFFNLSEPRPFCGETEVYADMIRDIFDIDMKPLSGPMCELTYTICMSCIFKLREAIQFKKQVQSCEDKFLDYYYTNKLEVIKKREVPKTIIKIEPVIEFKEEYLNEDVDSNDDTNPDFEIDDDDDDGDDDDDESKSDDDLEFLSKKGKGKGKGKPAPVVPKSEAATVKTEQKTPSKKLVKVERIKVPVKKKGNTTAVQRYILRKSEDGTNEFVCKTCQRVFRNRQCFYQHHNGVHLKKRPKLRSCYLCDAKVPGYKRAFHMEKEHGLPAPACNACGKKFPYPFLVLQHQKNFHMGEKKFSCPTCNLKTTSQSLLRKHILVHIAERPFKCNICDKKFRWKKNLKTHMAIHLNERKHVCEICLAAFVQSSSLKYHMTKKHLDHV